MSAYDEYLNLLERFETKDFEDKSFEIKERVYHLASNSNQMQVYKILQHTLSLDDYHPYKRWVLGILPNIYQKHTSLRRTVIKTLNDSYFDKHLEFFYRTAIQIASISQDSDDRIYCLDKINLRINSKDNSCSDLKNAFHELGRLMKSDIPNKSYIAQIIKQAMNNPANDEASISKAEHILDSQGNLKSNAFVCRRAQKTQEAPFCIKQTHEVDLNAPCVFVLPGDATLSEKELNGYLSDIDSLLIRNHLEKSVGVYGCFYDFGEYMNRNIAIVKQMEKHHRLHVHITDTEEENIAPKYVDVLFEKLLLPRIQDKNGKKRSLSDAQKYIRNINFFAHCHGGYTFLKMEERLEEKMKVLGYTVQERQQIFDNLLCVAFAPFAPMGASKSQMISFIAADDDVIRQYNHAEFHIRNMDAKGHFKPSYFPKNQGNCFIVSNIYKKSNNHAFAGFKQSSEYLTDEGIVLMNMMKNILISALYSSIQSKNLPKIQELSQKNRTDFETLERNGREMWQKILQKTKESALEKRILKSVRRTEEFGL